MHNRGIGIALAAASMIGMAAASGGDELLKAIDREPEPPRRRYAVPSYAVRATGSIADRPHENTRAIQRRLKQEARAAARRDAAG